MPCTGGGPSAYEERDDLQREVNKLEGMLCDACTQIVDSGSGLPASCTDWYEEHERQEAESLRRAALKKLTPRERRLLGLK